MCQDGYGYDEFWRAARERKQRRREAKGIGRRFMIDPGDWEAATGESVDEPVCVQIVDPNEPTS